MRWLDSITDLMDMNRSKLWEIMKGREDPLEEEMATHSNSLAWKIPRTEEPDRLHSSWDSKDSDMTE